MQKCSVKSSCVKKQRLLSKCSKLLVNNFIPGRFDSPKLPWCIPPGLQWGRSAHLTLTYTFWSSCVWLIVWLYPRLQLPCGLHQGRLFFCHLTASNGHLLPVSHIFLGLHWHVIWSLDDINVALSFYGLYLHIFLISLSLWSLTRNKAPFCSPTS